MSNVPKPAPPPTSKRRERLTLKGRKPVGPDHDRRRHLAIEPAHALTYNPREALSMEKKTSMIIEEAEKRGIIDDPQQLIELALTFNFGGNA